jgi:glycosyltransferase involved in cell wall biosynthesis
MPYDRVRAFNLPADPVNQHALAKARYLGPIIAMHNDSSLRAWLDAHYDVVLVCTPVVLTADLLPLLKRSAQASAVGMFMWDFFPLAQVEAGVFSPRLGRVVAPLERSLVKYVDVAFPMSPRGAEFTREYFRRPQMTSVVVPPWGSEVVLDSYEQGPLHEHITVVWGGQFSKRRAVGDILAVAERMKSERPDIRFRFAGSGSLRDRFERDARERALSNVVFEGALVRGDYHRWLSRADIALSAIEPGSTPSFPSKTVDYSQRSLPIVASVEAGNDFGTILES